MNITLPVGIGFIDWADQVATDLEQVASVGSPESDEKWQDWASQFFYENLITGVLPNPYQFSDWREWADRFCQVIQGQP